MLNGCHPLLSLLTNTNTHSCLTHRKQAILVSQRMRVCVCVSVCVLFVYNYVYVRVLCNYSKLYSKQGAFYITCAAKFTSQQTSCIQYILQENIFCREWLFLENRRFCYPNNCFLNFTVHFCRMQCSQYKGDCVKGDFVFDSGKLHKDTDKSVSCISTRSL